MTPELALLQLELRLYWTVAIVYVLATLVGIFYLWSRTEGHGRMLTRLLLVNALLHSLLILFRTFEGMRPPFQTLYETLSWFAWTATVTYLFVRSRLREFHLSGLFVAAVAAGACLFGLLSRNPEIVPIPPALQSAWYEWHVIVAFAAYAVFVVSFSMQVVVLMAKWLGPLWAEDFGVETARLEKYAYNLVLAGFPLLTFAIVSGAAWANDTWGRYWSWDPKETWSLITWTVYGIYLHTKAIPNWSEKVAGWINVLGFVCMVMTFIGINWLTKLLNIPSMHTYAM